MMDIFRKDGHLQDLVLGYEFRAEQLHMADFIHERLVEHENAIIEAGTGTGKTLAYLLPALIHARENDAKVGVTTETKALQKQLMDKDLPLVRKLLSEKMGIDFTYALCMGGANYPCRHRYEAAIKKGIFDKDDLARLSATRRLFNEGVAFSRFDAPLPGKIWSEICREADACGQFRCIYAQTCPYQRARKEWMAADLLVMNHYLFFTHIASGKTYLPQTDIIIFDEAHSVEDIASAQLGFDCSSSILRDIMERFHNPRKRTDLLSHISDEKKRSAAKDLWQDILTEAHNFFEKMRDRMPRDAQQMRLQRTPGAGSETIVAMNAFLTLLAEVEDDFDDEQLKMEFEIPRGKLFLFMESLNSFISSHKEDYVYWIEAGGTDLLSDIHCKGQPIRIADIMRREVMNGYESAIFVSATLSISGDFSYTASRLGMERFKSQALPSPFDFRRQAILFLDKNLSEPSHPSFIREAARRAAEIIKIVNGNCLMLFTSYRMLEDVRSQLADMVPHHIYSQGDLPSQEAVALYIEDDNSILMGTHSFWQGIDLPGDLLRCVIMMRLPFSVPDSPPIQARIEKLQEQGRNPFMAYQIPEAVIKFKQGFGRLIRSRQDRGIVAILDSRIITKPYGRNFLKSLPDCRMAYQIQGLAENYSGLLAADEPAPEKE
jgi:ATP-dependent DNA helicase DinG